MEASAEFDEFSNDYEQRLDNCVKLSGQDAEYFAEVKAELLLAEMREFGIDPKTASVLDFGCGTGSNAVHIVDHVGQLVGSDVSGASLRPATTNAPSAGYVHTGDVRLPFRDASFDAILVSCVLHHIKPTDRVSVVEELGRTLRPGGFIFIVEHNPFNPATRWIVNRCEFDEDAILLTATESRKLLTAAGLPATRHRYVLFLPGRGRLISKINGWLHRIPMGAQYSVSARRPSAAVPV